MLPLPELHEELLANILPYVTETNASLSCQTWKDYLYDALKLEPRIRFMQRIQEDGSAAFCYNALRPLGEDFEESVGYHFTFFKEGMYRLAWTRTYDAWSSQGEQHYGKWTIYMDHLCCETMEPEEKAGETEMRYAPAGYKFSIPLNDILMAKGGYFQAKDGSKAADWELPVRIGKTDSDTILAGAGMEDLESTERPQVDIRLNAPPSRADARFVEIDGLIHEVSGDIVANWSEEEWPRLMRCRLRFGIRG